MDGLPGNLDRQTCQPQRHTRHVTIILASLVRATENDIFNTTCINICSSHRLGYHKCSQVVRADIFETSTITPNRCTYPREHHPFFHTLTSLPLHSALLFSI